MFGCVLAQQRCLVSFPLSKDTMRHRYQSYGARHAGRYIPLATWSRLRDRRSDRPALILAKPGTALPLAPFPSPLCAHAYGIAWLHTCLRTGRVDDVHVRLCAIATRLSLGPKVTPQAYMRNSSKCPEKRIKGYEKQLKEFKKRLKPVPVSWARTFKPSSQTCMGEQIFQRGSKYFKQCLKYSFLGEWIVWGSKYYVTCLRKGSVRGKRDRPIELTLYTL